VCLGSSFTWSEEKKKKGFPHREDEGTKCAKRLFALRVPSLLRFLGVKKRRTRVSHKEDEGTKWAKGLFRLRVPSQPCVQKE
jgi:hypothetical protein